MWNKELTASEVKEDYSGASVPFKYKGANQTDIVSGWDFTSGWTTTGGASVTDADTIAWSSTGNVQKDYSLQKGKSYRLRIVAGTIGGNTLMYAGSGTGEQLIGTLSASSTNIFEFTITNDIPDGELVFYSNVSGTTNITSVTLTTIGAVAEYDGSGIASDKWFDKSGNDLHGTVSGASVENAPAGDDGLVYEEGTFTVTTNSDGSGAMSAQVGEYTRIGNAVHFRICINVSTNFASNTIGGLPYTCNQSASPSSLVGGLVALTSNANDEPITATVSTGGTTVSFFSGTDATDTHLPNTTNDVYRLSGTYFT